MIIGRIDRNGGDPPRLVRLRDLSPDSAVALVGVGRYKNRIPSAYGVNDIGIAGSLVGSSDVVSVRGRGPIWVGEGRPNCRPARSRNRRGVDSPYHLLTSGDNMSWKRCVHAECRKEVAATIAAELSR